MADAAMMQDDQDDRIVVERILFYRQKTMVGGPRASSESPFFSTKKAYGGKMEKCGSINRSEGALRNTAMRRGAKGYPDIEREGVKMSGPVQMVKSARFPRRCPPARPLLSILIGINSPLSFNADRQSRALSTIASITSSIPSYRGSAFMARANASRFVR
jgi:hypothetical protein